MSEFFLLRGRRFLMREICAAWVGVTVGSIMFGIITSILSPSMGMGVAIVASLVVTTPVAAMLSQSMRAAGRRKSPPISKIRTDSPRRNVVLDFEDIGNSRKLLNAITFAGLDVLSGTEISKKASPIISDAPDNPASHIKIFEGDTITIDESSSPEGPIEYATTRDGDQEPIVIKIDRENRTIDLNHSPYIGIS
jgi:hypothetical protein